METEFISGLADARCIDDVATSPEERARIECRLAEPAVWDAFCDLLSARGLPMPPEDSDLRRESLVRIAREPMHAGSFAVSEGLLDHDEALATWRQNHILMVSSARSAASTAPETRAESRSFAPRSAGDSSPSSGTCEAIFSGRGMWPPPATSWRPRSRGWSRWRGR